MKYPIDFPNIMCYRIHYIMPPPIYTVCYIEYHLEYSIEYLIIYPVYVIPIYSFYIYPI